jgi:hypothetical protein
MKIYNQVNGECKNSTLYRECQNNKAGIKHFLESKRLFCGDGKIVKVVDSEVV